MRKIIPLVGMILVGLIAPGTLAAPDSGVSSQTSSEAREAIARGLDYLRRTQNKEGGWSEKYGPAVTALGGNAFANDDRYGPRHEIVRRAVTAILRFEQTDGGIYERWQNLANYQTSIVVSFLASLDDPAMSQRIAKAQAFLTNLQYDDEESVDSADAWYGGAGYNSKKRPDLSNTQMMLQALHDSGLSKSHPVYQKALKFVSRCQMNDATNDQKYADGATNGGFIYSAANKGESKAGPSWYEMGKPLRPYGSMTYAGFKSMLYANLGEDDARIKSCLEWIRHNYTLDTNPGMRGRHSEEGLYYYFHVFSKALDAYDRPVIEDASGRQHNWREELCRKVVSLQKKDGSWENDASRFNEGDADYVTALTILTLQTALDEPKVQREAKAEENS